MALARKRRNERPNPAQDARRASSPFRAILVSPDLAIDRGGPRWRKWGLRECPRASVVRYAPDPLSSCADAPHHFMSKSPLHDPAVAPLPDATSETRNTTCYMCACRCGIRVHLRNGQVRYIEGNPDHPINKGVICAKGSSGIMKQYSPARLTTDSLRIRAVSIYVKDANRCL